MLILEVPCGGALLAGRLGASKKTSRTDFGVAAAILALKIGHVQARLARKRQEPFWSRYTVCLVFLENGVKNHRKNVFKSALPRTLSVSAEGAPFA